MIFPIDRLLDERFLNDLTIDNNGIPIITQNNLLASGDLPILLISITVPRSALDPTLGDVRRTPGIFTLTERTGQDQPDIPPHPLSEPAVNTRTTVSGHFGSSGSRYTDVVEDG